MAIATIVISLAIGFAIGVWWQRTRTPDPQANYAAEVARKAQRKAQILELFSTQPEISNDDVQNTLGVSDASATNYLSELESEGAIVQLGGQEGPGVRYRKAS